MLEALKEQVFKANLLLPKHNLVTFTWGNVSAIDPESRLIVIKPSGVDYADMSADQMVIIDLDGNIVEGKFRPSSDTPTHIELYKSFKDVRAIVHTHSRWGTIFAQSHKSIPILGTTHADYFAGDIPVTRILNKQEIESDYERNTGTVIIEAFAGINPLEIPGVVVASHGCFSFGKNAHDAVHNAVVLEEVAMMAWHTVSITSHEPPTFPKELLQKHYERKHGAGAYYGQS